MYGHTAFRSKILLGHNAKCYRKAIKFDRNSAFAAYFCSIHIENDFIVTTVIRYFVIVEFTRLKVCIFFEHTEIFRLVTIGYGYPRKRQYSVHAGIFIVACKEIKRSTCSEIQQV
ncbi:hypothetical protein D3C78_1528940 [compost metagenome]